MARSLAYTVTLLVTLGVAVVCLPPQSVVIPSEIVDIFYRTPCPGSTEDTCENGQTCCKLQPEGFGCCPMEDAVCCSDGLHCCPHNTRCDLAHMTCLRETETEVLEFDLMSVESTRSIEPLEVEEILLCPDEKSHCNSGQTCCEMSEGFGCCPVESGVCCGDGEHCCPLGSTCDVTTSTCIWPQVAKILQTPLLKKEPAQRNFDFNFQSDDVILCPDPTFSCLISQTCCQIPDGWGCCPVPDAVCCEDYSTCCPHSSTCNLTTSTCDWTDELYVEGPMTAALKLVNFSLEIQPAVGDSATCADLTYSCDEGQTCCQLPDHQFGCCPFDNGVCCSDGIHCCPEGSQCDIERGACIHENIIGQMFYHPLTTTAQNWQPSEFELSDVICPDKEFRCHDGQTCCQLYDGGYGCCPMPDAVCCQDKIHCCPKDTTCSVETGSCISTLGLPWFNEKWTNPEKIEIYPSQGVVVVDSNKLENSTDLNIDCGEEHVECEDGETCCPAGNTCCDLPGSGMGCCPALNADCCMDGKHCCYSGMICTNTGTEPYCKFPDLMP